MLGMIITGASRAIIVKLSYQSGFEAPLAVTLLYLAGQSLSLIVYLVQRKMTIRGHDYATIRADGIAANTKRISKSANEEASSSEPDDDHHDQADMKIEEDGEEEEQLEQLDNHVETETLQELEMEMEIEIPKGSSHGLTQKSTQRIQWIHSVPWYLKPAIPAFFNLLNSALRWAAMVYIDASIAEMLISGLELTLSVVAARIFRSRRIGIERWLGVAIVTLGIIIIERANDSKHASVASALAMDMASEGAGEIEDDGINMEGLNDDTASSGDTCRTYEGREAALVGVVLIIVQSILSVLQDLSEEIFMQAAHFPPMMMLGMEGSYGLFFGIIIYFTVGDKLCIEDTSLTQKLLKEHPQLRWWMILLPIIFFVTGVFNIKATEVTSAMTRNVWKNFRTILVWVMSLLIFYIGGNTDYGEQWFVPESFFILLGLVVMSSGIIVYYWYKEAEKVPVIKLAHANASESTRHEIFCS